MHINMYIYIYIYICCLSSCSLLEGTCGARSEEAGGVGGASEAHLLCTVSSFLKQTFIVLAQPMAKFLRVRGLIPRNGRSQARISLY